MKGMREIKGRIKAVKNTAQITRAMQLVAASKMRKAQDATVASRPYSLLMAEIMASLPEDFDVSVSPLLQKRKVKKRGVLVISTDKGLCGALNANLFRSLPDHEKAFEGGKEGVSYVAVGRKGAQFLARSGRDLKAEFTISDEVLFSEVKQVVDFMIEGYLNEDFDTIDILYPSFVNTLTQSPVFTNLVPIADLRKDIQDMRDRFGGDNYRSSEDHREMNFEPSANAILSELSMMYLRHQIYQRILEMKASEQSARMVAMKSATDNANNLVDDLTLEYNKARQAGITQEILEIAAATANA